MGLVKYCLIYFVCAAIVYGEETTKCIKCSGETCADTVNIGTVTERCDLVEGAACERYSYTNKTAGLVTVRDCVSNYTKTTCDELKATLKDQIKDEATWACYTCDKDMCNSADATPAVTNHCVQCSDYESCKDTVDISTVEGRCDLAAGAACERYSYIDKDAQTLVTVRDCVSDPKMTHCDDLKVSLKDKIKDEATWACYTCDKDMCNKDDATPAATNHCVKCSDYESCKDTVNTTTVTTTCELAQGSVCETFTYKDATGVFTVRDCVDKAKTCDVLKTENKNKTSDESTWGCYTCESDLCNTTPAPAAENHCVECSDYEPCKDTVDISTVGGRCDLAAGAACERYSYTDKTAGLVTVRGCVSDPKTTTCDDLKATLKDKMTDEATWACYTCEKDMCNKDDAPAPAATNHCVKCSDYESCKDTVNTTQVTTTCDLAAGSVCETFSYKDTIGVFTVRDCVDKAKTCDVLKTENKNKTSDESTWGCYTCEGDLCNTVPAPAAENHCVECSDYKSCKDTVDISTVGGRCDLAAGAACERYSYTDKTAGLVTVRGCVSDPKTTTCDDLKATLKDKMTDEATWACYTCEKDMCNKDDATPAATNHCVKCSDYESCKDTVNTTQVTTTCDLAAGAACERYSYTDKETDKPVTIRDCVSDPKVTRCDDLKVSLKNKIKDEATWACYTCDKDMCNKDDATPAATNHCVKCSDYQSCKDTVNTTQVTTTCDLAAGSVCETFSYKDTTGVLTVRDCVDKAKTCDVLKTENKDKISDESTWGCYTCEGDLCNKTPAPAAENHCVECSDYESCKDTVDTSKVGGRCDLAAGAVCERYSYTDKTAGLVTVRGCVSDPKTTTCDDLKATLKDKMTDEATWACYTCDKDMCNKDDATPAATNHCVQCSDYETCSDTVDTSKVGGRCDLVDGTICERHSYKDATGTLTVRNCISNTTTCDNLKTAHKGDITSDSSWHCYTCDGDLCNKENSAGNIGLSLLLLVAGALISLYFK